VTGQTKSGSEAHHEKKNIKDRYVRPDLALPHWAPPWSQAWGWGSQASAWWQGLCPRDPAGLSPKWRRVGPPSSRLTTTCRKAWALEPSSLRGAGPSTTLELPRVSGGELVWACSHSSPAQPPYVLEFTPVNAERSLPCAFGWGWG
ncbi:hypothetical protein L3Q82_022525, partial [Scortum barcoo]